MTTEKELNSQENKTNLNNKESEEGTLSVTDKIPDTLQEVTQEMTPSKEKTFAEEEIDRIIKQQEEERFLQPLEIPQIEFKMGKDKMTTEKENKLIEIFKRNYKEFKVGSNASRVIVECCEAGKSELLKELKTLYNQKGLSALLNYLGLQEKWTHKKKKQK